MKILFWYVILLLFAIVTLHFGALYTGTYDRQIEEGFVWWDNVLHVLVGIVFGLAWLWLLQKLDYNIDSRFAILTMLLFILLMALGWEGVEYLARLYLKSLAEGLQIFSPNLTEASSDIFSDVLGGMLLLFYLKFLGRPSSNSF